MSFPERFTLAGVSCVACGAGPVSPQQKRADGWHRKTFLGRSHPSCPTGVFSWLKIHGRSVVKVSKSGGCNHLPTTLLRGLILARSERAWEGQKGPMTPCPTGVQEVQDP